MKRLAEFLLESMQWPFINKDVLDVLALEQWLSKLSISSKPKGVSSLDHRLMQEISKSANVLVHNYKRSPIKHLFHVQNREMFNVISLFDKLSLSLLEIEQSYGGQDEKSKVVEINGVTYIKNDSSSYSVFVKNVQDVSDFLKTLKGFHRKVVPGLTVIFVGSVDQKAVAKYKKDSDSISIKAQKTVSGEKYGSLRYVILHELGHRFLVKYPQRWGHDDVWWITTEYSRTDNYSGEEKFAELFALSHWPNFYSKYKDKIDLFIKSIVNS